MHWNLPSNPVDLEQREGRVHRYKGHAVRKNIAEYYGLSALHSLAESADPWTQLFALAASQRKAGQSDLIPYWILRKEPLASSAGFPYCRTAKKALSLSGSNENLHSTV